MDEILFEMRDGTGWVTLNRPRTLNSLTHDMARQLDARLEAWAADDAVARVVIEGAGGRAFCAGGDIRDLYGFMERGDEAFYDIFYRDEYRLNYRIHTYRKPYVALIDGVVMGGGVGVSIHGSRRIVTEHCLFAMPETGIGFFPDVGGTWFLPRMPGEIGMYLGLTGARLGPADALYCGVATHFAPRARLPDALDGFSADPGPPPMAAHRAAIDRCFAGDSIEAIVAALEAEGGDWAGETLASLATKSPTSLKVTYRQLREGASLSFDQAMTMEFRLSQRFCAAPDFREGVRAVVIDKDRDPQWRPPTLADVAQSDVDGYFAPPAGDDLLF